MGVIELFMTDFMSQNFSSGPSDGNPKHLNLYCRASIIYVAVLRATNSDPKLEASTVFWYLLYQIMGALLTYMMIPEYDLLFAMFSA